MIGHRWLRLAGLFAGVCAGNPDALAQPVDIDVAPLSYLGATQPSASEPAAREPAAGEGRPDATIVRTERLQFLGTTPVQPEPPPSAAATATPRVAVATAELVYHGAGLEDDSGARESPMTYVEFDRSPVAGSHLNIDVPVVSTDAALTVEFHGLPNAGRHYLYAWLTSTVRPRRMAQHRTDEGQISGVWQAPLSVAGSYLVCVATADAARTARRAAENSNECLTAHALWGDPDNPPRPQVTVEPEFPVAREDFLLSYTGMPTDARGKIFVHEAGAGARAHPVTSVTAYDGASGSQRLRIYAPGEYEVRIDYERNGRQIRATRPLTVIPRNQERAP